MRRFLHTMIRVRDLEKSLDFYGLLGLRELRRCEVREGRYTLVYLGFEGQPEGAEIELTYNWDRETPYSQGDGFGHLAFGVRNLADMVEEVRQGGGKVIREPGPVKFGKTVIAFLEDPDGYKIELIEE